jgi:hypothetical protein
VRENDLRPHPLFHNPFLFCKDRNSCERERERERESVREGGLSHEFGGKIRIGSVHGRETRGGEKGRTVGKKMGGNENGSRGISFDACFLNFYYYQG